MYEELFKKEIDQIVVIIGGEDGSIVSYVKEKKDYISKLEEVVEDFYKMFELEYGKSSNADHEFAQMQNIYHRYIKLPFSFKNQNGQMSKELSVKNKRVVVNTLT